MTVVLRLEFRILGPVVPILGLLTEMTVGHGLRNITVTMTMVPPTHTDVLRHEGGTHLPVQEMTDVPALNTGAVVLLEIDPHHLPVAGSLQTTVS